MNPILHRETIAEYLGVKDPAKFKTWDVEVSGVNHLPSVEQAVIAQGARNVIRTGELSLRLDAPVPIKFHAIMGIAGVQEVVQ